MSGRAEQVRAARELFQRALAAGVTLEECRRREAAERWSAADARLATKRADGVAAARPLQWWQR